MCNWVFWNPSLFWGPGSAWGRVATPPWLPLKARFLFFGSLRGGTCHHSARVFCVGSPFGNPGTNGVSGCRVFHGPQFLQTGISFFFAGGPPRHPPRSITELLLFLVPPTRGPRRGVSSQSTIVSSPPKQQNPPLFLSSAGGVPIKPAFSPVRVGFPLSPTFETTPTLVKDPGVNFPGLLYCTTLCVSGNAFLNLFGPLVLTPSMFTAPFWTSPTLQMFFGDFWPFFLFFRWPLVGLTPPPSPCPSGLPWCSTWLLPACPQCGHFCGKSYLGVSLCVWDIFFFVEKSTRPFRQKKGPRFLPFSWSKKGLQMELPIFFFFSFQPPSVLIP